MKQTAVAPANIAFIKYWGKKDEVLRLPANSSFSMNLDKCLTMTTVEFDKKYKKDSFEIIGEKVSEKEEKRVVKFLERLRKMAGVKLFVRIVSQNSFPKSSGIASSASGFAALSVSTASALNLFLSEKELTIMARLGSGSACRSIPDGFVEWKEGKISDESYAYSLYPPSYWDLRDILVIVSKDRKKVPTTEGMERSKLTSIFYQTRIDKAKKLLPKLKNAFEKKDFKTVGSITEQDCINMHCVMMSTIPRLFYWSPTTLDIIKSVSEWRKQEVEVYFTMDAGPNAHLICEGKNKDQVLGKLKSISGIEKVIINKPAGGAHLVHRHLF